MSEKAVIRCGRDCGEGRSCDSVAGLRAPDGLAATDERRDIKALGAEGLAQLVESLGHPAYRAKQIARWLYGGSEAARSGSSLDAATACHAGRFDAANVDAERPRSAFESMTDLPKELRSKLADSFRVGKAAVEEVAVSSDKTRKYLLRLHDGAVTECVGMPSKNKRLTVCCSTQAGCSIGCAFCATARNGLTRSLLPGEIVDQVSLVADDFAGREDASRVSNVVLMGQGEPFANYQATLAAMRLINDPQLIGVGARHMTVSTCGIIKMIRRFEKEPEQFTLAVSLHSASQATRAALMPGVAGVSVTELREAIASYYSGTKRRPSIEYVLLKDVNDTDEEVDLLAAFCLGAPPFDCGQAPLPSGAPNAATRPLCGAFHVNLIGYNSFEGSPFVPTPPKRAADIASRLRRRGIETSVRHSRGSDIAAACGQLASRAKAL
jgi:23S rRNA (adenine2503-C2)-methyltransferase